MASSCPDVPTTAHFWFDLALVDRGGQEELGTLWKVRGRKSRVLDWEREREGQEDSGTLLKERKREAGSVGYFMESERQEESGT